MPSTAIALPPVDDALGQGGTDAGQTVQFVGGGGVDVQGPGPGDGRGVQGL